MFYNIVPMSTKILFYCFKYVVNAIAQMNCFRLLWNCSKNGMINQKLNFNVFVHVRINHTTVDKLKIAGFFFEKMNWRAKKKVTLTRSEHKQAKSTLYYLNKST